MDRALFLAMSGAKQNMQVPAIACQQLGKREYNGFPC